MKIFFHNHNNQATIKLEGENLVLNASKPAIIQPSEIIRISTDISLKTEMGYLLYLYTHPNLVQKICQIFPAVIIIDDQNSDKALEIPVMNCGRNPLNLMVGQALVVGRSLKAEKVEIEAYTFDLIKQEVSSKSNPQKKNTGVKFEMK